MTIINSKTIARIATIQFTYQITMNNSLDNYAKILEEVKNYYLGPELLDDLEVSNKMLKIKLHKTFFADLSNIIIKNINAIDDHIKKHLSAEWNFENLHLNLKAILRCGIAELVYFPEVPSKVVINEYTNIASDMLKNQEVGFINSILDTINKEVRKDAS